MSARYDSDEHYSEMFAFVQWLQRFAGVGGYCPGFFAWNWRIRGVLVTLWMQTGIVKIYHDEGRRTEHYNHNTEACREDVIALIGP